jgi:hypothetical protein
VYRDYTRGTEAERLRLERLEPFTVGLWQHGRTWQPWPLEQARKDRATARAILFDPNHVAEHHGDWSELSVTSCGTCELNGTRAAMFPSDPSEHDDSQGPNYSGWERLYVQAGATIPDAWRESFARWLTPEGEAENSRYAECLGRDIATHGLRDPRGLVRP